MLLCADTCGVGPGEVESPFPDFCATCVRACVCVCVGVLTEACQHHGFNRLCTHPCVAHSDMCVSELRKAWFDTTTVGIGSGLIGSAEKAMLKLVSSRELMK